MRQMSIDKGPGSLAQLDHNRRDLGDIFIPSGPLSGRPDKGIAPFRKKASIKRKNMYPFLEGNRKPGGGSRITRPWNQ